MSIDLEVDPKTARIFAFAAVASTTTTPIIHGKGDTGSDLTRLDAFCQRFDHVIGHSILRHDLPHLAAASPRLSALAEAPIDTLWRNPFAFPRNPYHHLVKHYHDGRLQSGHVNDPEQDAKLVFAVPEDQIDAFDRLNATTPDTLIASHFLTTRGARTGGFDWPFSQIRGAGTPPEAEAHAAIRRLLAGQACDARLGEALEGLREPALGWPMAYALSWIPVAGGDSVIVRRQGFWA